ncbi:hypothetical protein [Microbacterium immunditiarum]|uniref:Uncharacterized protein n=1 Tax=Microbacterium immunditiarum TaxID=337480 RepID=A0A7Y9KLP7_9MICO|nr:hypothetical protein [Microbacterium immunditiarum]NYE20498.1 hypothetical protein [Microbacterium immunditiarum]
MHRERVLDALWPERIGGVCVDTLALAERWSDPVVIAPGDERAHVAVMREKLARVRRLPSRA